MKVLVVGSGGREHAIVTNCGKKKSHIVSIKFTRSGNARYSSCRVCTDPVPWSLINFVAFTEHTIDFDRWNG